MKRLAGLWLAAVLSFLAIRTSAPAVTLAWNPNPESDIAGYRLSYGTLSGVYSNTVETSGTTMTVSSLEEGRTYYFVVKAVNQAGLESDPSDEIAYQIPVPNGQPPGAVVSPAGWTLSHVDSEETPAYGAGRAFDGDPDTFWHTAWTSGSTPPPHELQIDLGGVQEIGGFRYLPRQDAYTVGNIAQYEFYVSMDGINWGGPVATGTFANSKTGKEVFFSIKTGRYVRLRQITEVNGFQDCNVAELEILPGGLPLPWSETNIGEVDPPAGVSASSGIFTFQGCGTLSGTADTGNFVWQTLSGNGGITARVSITANATNSSLAGVMIRDSLAPNSKHVFVGVDGGGGWHLIRRSTPGGAPVHTTGPSGSMTNLWLRLKREGSTITAYKSRDGRKWQRIGRIKRKVLSLGATCYVGFSVNSETQAPCTAAFSGLNVIP